MVNLSHNFLYATDLEDGSESVLAYAIDLANRLGARLHVLIGISDLREKSLIELDTHIPQEKLDQYHEDRADRVKRHVQAQINAFYAVRKDAPERPILEITVQEGDETAKLILDHAAVISADVIIMGARGEGRLSTLLFGSVVQDVMRKSSTPLLLVPVGRVELPAGDAA